MLYLFDLGKDTNIHPILQKLNNSPKLHSPFSLMSSLMPPEPCYLKSRVSQLKLGVRLSQAEVLDTQRKQELC